MYFIWRWADLWSYSLAFCGKSCRSKEDWSPDRVFEGYCFEVLECIRKSGAWRESMVVGTPSLWSSVLNSRVFAASKVLTRVYISSCFLRDSSSWMIVELPCFFGLPCYFLDLSAFGAALGFFLAALPPARFGDELRAAGGWSASPVVPFEASVSLSGSPRSLSFAKSSSECWSWRRKLS